jgi:anti-anti-sigma regulatory factor
MSKYETKTREQLLKDISELERQSKQLLSILNGIDEIICVVNPENYELLYINGTFKNIYGDTLSEKCHKAIWDSDSPCSFCTNDLVFGDYLGKSYIWEYQNEKNKEWFRCFDKAIRWVDGRMVRFELAVNVSKQKNLEKETQEKLDKQAKLLLELSTPVIKIWDGIVVAPLIGNLDIERTQQFMERFLETIVKSVSPVAMIDITGVATVDTQTAQNVIEAITAARLLGTNVILTGVNPGIAQTLVHLGIDLNDVQTCSSLSRGLQIGFDFLGLEVIKKEKDIERLKNNG